MAITWPSGNKPATTTTDADSDSISGARADINKALTNQNVIIDAFNIGTSQTNGYILAYNSTDDRFNLVANSSGGNPLTADLEVADFDIINSAGAHRGDTFQIGGATTVQTSTSSVISGIPSQFDAAGGSSQRLAGPIEMCIIDDLNAWNDRVHSLAKLTSVKLTADFTGNSQPRIRNNYVELSVDTAGHNFGPSSDKFGDGAIGQFITSKVFNSGTDASTARSLTAMLAAPQIDGNTGDQTVTQMRGMFVQPFLDDHATATNLYGYIYKDDNIDGSATVTNHYSFFSDSTTAQFKNDGPAILKGLAYPTSDGSAGQVIKTNGSATLSFTSIGQGTNGSHTITSPTGSSETLTADRNNGMVQFMDVNSNVESLVIAVPSNMVAGDQLVLVLKGNRGTSTNLSWQGIYNAYGTGAFGLTNNSIQRITIVRDASNYTSITSGNLAAGN